MSSVTFSGIKRSGGSRWLLPASLALNLFFVGIAGSMAVREFTQVPETIASQSDAARIERIASTLPQSDAEKLRTQFASQRAAIETARETIGKKQDEIRVALRAEPFNVEEMRRAMAEGRAARERLYQMLGGVVSSAAEQMSKEGRNKLADWRPPGRQ
jgi:uncharacterized membrane protein